MTVIDDDAPVDDAPVDEVRRWRAVTVALVVVVMAVGVWWAWPTWSGADGQLDVLVAADTLVTDAERSVELRVREEGMTVAWTDAIRSWCDDPTAFAEQVDRTDPVHVVLSFAGGAADGECVARTLRAVGDRHVVVVQQPGAGPEATAALASVDVVDPARLVGGPAPTVLACEWWEDCPPGGVQVRDVDGRLTDAGGERLARMIVAAVRGA